ncbi:unnamed protein product [Pocillopora meandrina]|uniref:Uncharacterized protein n=1 Tax=Pocillopora meandrina TaxID=46732 RepID=A0AAU9XTZ8_9CNID|nr:unnamed protein product [Pocillopora meandrina]
MASGFTPAAKRSRTENEGASVRKRGEELGIPSKDICPAKISKRLAESHLPFSSVQPVRLHVEAKEDIHLFVDEFTEAELFRQLKGTPGHKAIIGKEEASHFFEQLLGGLREKNTIDFDRLIQLYNGGTWVYARDDEITCQFIDNPAVSLSGYSQPGRFVPIS